MKSKAAVYSATYRAAHKDRKAASNAAYSAAHREDKAVWMAIWHQEHKEDLKPYLAAWWRAHPESVRARNARHRTRVKSGMDKLDRALSVAYRKAIANDPCFYCGAPGEHDDHYVSLANGGTDHWWNLVRACAHCNLRKNSKNGDEFVVILSLEAATLES
jgi:5-methylcytosine-specific restriction endonuclease McrA